MRKILIAAAVLVIALVVALTGVLHRGSRNIISYTQFIQRVQAGDVSDVTIQDDVRSSRATIRLKNGEVSHAILPADYSLALKILQNKLVNVEIQDAASNPYRILAHAAPFLLLLAVWCVLMLNRERLVRWRG